MHKCAAAYAVMRCLSVCVCVSAVTFVYCVKTNKRIFKIFLSSGRHTILVFPYQTGWQYSDGTSLTGASNADGVRQKSRFWANIWLQCVLLSVPAASTVNLAATNHAEFITLVVGERPSSLMVVNNDEVYDNKPQRYAEDNVTQWLIWNLSNNNKRFRTCYFVEANYWRTQSIARPLCISRATCHSAVCGSDKRWLVSTGIWCVYKYSRSTVSGVYVKPTICACLWRHASLATTHLAHPSPCHRVYSRTRVSFIEQWHWHRLAGGGARTGS